MSFNLTELDAHEQPSDEMRAEWKGFSRQEHTSLLNDPRVDDPRAPLEISGFQTAGNLPQAQVAGAFAKLGPEYASFAQGDAPIIFHPLLPGM